MSNEYYIRIPNKILMRQNLNSTEKLIYGYIFTLSSNDNKIAWPSDINIARTLDISVRTVQRSLRKLENEKLLKRRTTQLSRKSRSRTILRYKE
jgi:predicted ArsR family transcriptional regulator